MNIYLWRKNFTAVFSDPEKITRGKLAFKTKQMHWLDTEAPVIVPISVHSVFHDEVSGDLKMNAFISTIKNHVKGMVTILLTDRAHIQTVSLKYQNDSEKAFHNCLRSAQGLENRYSQYFQGCNVVYWHSYICKDECYSSCMKLLREMQISDEAFRNCLYCDAESSYNSERSLEFANKDLYIQKAVEDLLEQCACLLVIANKGYRFQFYPGKPSASTEYVNETLISVDQKISWIDVFLTIEKKTVLFQN